MKANNIIKLVLEILFTQHLSSLELYLLRAYPFSKVRINSCHEDGAYIRKSLIKFMANAYYKKKKKHLHAS